MMHKEKQYRRHPSVLAAPPCIAASFANIHGPSKAACPPGPWGHLGIWLTAPEGASESHQGQSPDARQVQEQTTQTGGQRCQERGSQPSAKWAWQAQSTSPDPTGRNGPPCSCLWPGGGAGGGGGGSRLRRDGRRGGLGHVKAWRGMEKEKAWTPLRPKWAQASSLGHGYLFSPGPSLDNHLPSRCRCGLEAFSLAHRETQSSLVLCLGRDRDNWGLSSVVSWSRLTHLLLEDNMMRKESLIWNWIHLCLNPFLTILFICDLGKVIYSFHTSVSSSGKWE